MRVVAIGDNCLDWYLDRQKVYPGGNAVNVSVFTRRLGADSSYIGQFGTDRAGDIMIAALADEGVDISRVRRVTGRSGYATVRNVEGERVFQGASNGVVAFDPSAADYEFMAGAALIHSGDSSFMGEHLERFAAIAPLSFDFSIKPTEYCSPILPHVSYATFSRPELDSAQVPDFIDWAHSCGAKYVLVTKGMAGSWVSDRTRIHHEPAVPTQVLDTLGAGDSFIAAMLMSLLRGESLAESAAFAAQFAAQSCRGYGAFGYEAAAAEMTLAADHRYE